MINYKLIYMTYTFITYINSDLIDNNTLNRLNNKINSI